MFNMTILPTFLDKKRGAGENVILELSKRRIGHEEFKERFQFTAAAEQIIHGRTVDHRHFNAKPCSFERDFCFGVREYCWKVIRVKRGKRSVVFSEITIADDFFIAFIKVTLTIFQQPGVFRFTVKAEDGIIDFELILPWPERMARCIQ